MPVETKLETQPRGGGEKLAELPAEIVVYGERLNRAGPISFQLAYGHPTCTRDTVGPGLHEAVITRNGEQVWVGPIWTADEPPKPESGPHLMSFAGEGLWSYAHRWHITSDLTFDDVDQFTIARTLIDHHQDKAGGDFGIDTSAVTLSGVTRDRTYDRFELKNIGEAVEQLADVEDGFDFAVNPADRAFDLHYPQRGSRKPDLIFDERTIRSFHRTIDAKAQASQTLAVGAGEGTSMIRHFRQDAGAVDQYLLTQHVYTNKSVSNGVTLLAHTFRELAKFKNPAEMLAIVVDTDEPPAFSYQVGDTMQVRWPSSYDTVNQFVRLVGRDIEWNQGEEQAVLYVRQVL